MINHITYPITDQKQFDRAVEKYNEANPPVVVPVADPIQMVSGSTLSATDNTKRIFLFEGSGNQTVTIQSVYNSLPNGTELQFIRFGSGNMNVTAGSGVSIAGIGDNGDATGPIQRMTMIKFGAAAWLLYSFVPYTAP